MRSSRHEAKGFSLLELMVVIGIFGVLLAIAVPGVAGYLRASRLRGAAGTLASDLRYARSLATAQRHTFAVTFAPGSYSVVRLSPPATVLTRQLPRGVACTAPDTTTFFAWGLTQAATITVADEDHSNTVRLLATGSVTHD
jgi:prepilin-type N-terminal cleavage/methylation domain-containing protein